MAFYMIGIGLRDESDISIKGLEAVKKCDKVYLENYTSVLNAGVEKLEKLYSKKIILADRNMVESKSDDILEDNTAFLVIGDVFGATTHTDLMLRAKKKGLDVRVINNASVLTAVGITGLELYKFGRTTSIVFPHENYMPQSPYDVIKENRELGLHTLCLLDIKTAEPSPEDIRKGVDNVQEPRFMKVNEAIGYLFDIEQMRDEKVFAENTLCVGCARLGSDNLVIAGKAKDLMSRDFGKAPHCLIIPGRLHHIEEEALSFYK